MSALYLSYISLAGQLYKLILSNELFLVLFAQILISLGELNLHANNATDPLNVYHKCALDMKQFMKLIIL